MIREIILDTETTGLNPFSGDRIIEIGCIEVVDRKKTGRVFHHYINPERNVPDDAFRIHGISTQFLKDKPKFKEIAKDFHAFIEDSTLVIHNAGFDMKFIHYEMKLENIIDLQIKEIIDTLTIARKKFPGSPANLDALCKRFHIDASSRTYHGALLDAELLFDVYIALTGGAQSSLNLNSATNNAIKSATREYRAPREFNVSEKELEQHKQFLSKLKKPIWSDIDA